jgi:hypothetical protein
MISKRNILAAVTAGLGLLAANAYAAAPATVGASFTVAKHGADDPTQPCDDHGTDLCYVAPHFVVAKNGADNPIEIEGPDDNGTDIVA